MQDERSWSPMPNTLWRKGMRPSWDCLGACATWASSLACMRDSTMPTAARQRVGR